MRAHKLDVGDLHPIGKGDDEPVFVPCNVENDPVLPTMLAFPYWALTSAGDFHSAWHASPCQVFKGSSESPRPGFSQNALRVETAMTRMAGF
jgi:hypothetical protein